MQWPRTEQAALLLALAAVVVGALVLLAVRRPPPPVRLIEPSVPAEIVVQVDGAVLRPGLYRLPPGSRVADAVRAAGGPAATANLDAVNGARVLRDGERIRIAEGEPAIQTTDAPAPVNVNTATAGELESLPGIGPVLAARIVEHRTRHGPFQTLEDLLRVEGIGPGLLNRLRTAVRFSSRNSPVSARVRESGGAGVERWIGAIATNTLA